MTEERLALAELIEKAGGGDFLHAVAAREEALFLHGWPQVFTTDQGNRFTSLAFTDVVPTGCNQLLEPLTTGALPGAIGVELQPAATANMVASR